MSPTITLIQIISCELDRLGQQLFTAGQRIRDDDEAVSVVMIVMRAEVSDIRSQIFSFLSQSRSQCSIICYIPRSVEFPMLSGQDTTES